ncbi:MAG: PHP domain-containing protein [Gemmatimonadetes bacterium]|nr:PHP domain-containing protein [Gemmatimonadota bacterium]
MTLTNAHLAELLALAAEDAEGHRLKALRRASRLAFLWPLEAADLLAAGRSLTDLAGIGPWLARVLRAWFEDPPYIPDPPALRRDFLTLAEARRILAQAPDTYGGLRGDLQMHSDWSDGSGTILEMAAAGVEHGYGYVGITDHSKGLKIAGGIDEAELREQEREVERVNRELSERGLGLRVLRSLEMNLSPEGASDMEPAALARLDLVLGSFHSQLRKTDDQTGRYLAALRNPDIQVLGHPRGRVYDFRLGLSADWRRVFGTAAELDKAVEIDAFPDRQDLNVELLDAAREAEVRISIGTDAHHPWQLGHVDLGLAAAVRAGIPRDRILNFMEADELVAWAERVRSRGRERRITAAGSGDGTDLREGMGDSAGQAKEAKGKRRGRKPRKAGQGNGGGGGI